ncbi:MAG TPA: zinc ribbon domain-containing protein [Nodosilinea sp.]|nr:zinc ribbon domain-containing protein [Nodosilinea sp.]
MPYHYNLGPSQKLYLDNADTTTIITLASGGIGQQQQSSTRTQTGPWLEIPQVLPLGTSVLVRCVAALGEFVWQVQGMQVTATDASVWQPAQAVPMAASETASPPPPITPLPPMAPLQMDPMEMSANPMTMRMGDMTLSMETPPLTGPAAQRFCTQCGQSLRSNDRFCGSCGHQVS